MPQHNNHVWRYSIALAILWNSANHKLSSLRPCSLAAMSAYILQISLCFSFRPVSLHSATFFPPRSHIPDPICRTLSLILFIILLSTSSAKSYRYSDLLKNLLHNLRRNHVLRGIAHNSSLDSTRLPSDALILQSNYYQKHAFRIWFLPSNHRWLQRSRPKTNLPPSLISQRSHNSGEESFIPALNPQLVDRKFDLVRLPN